MSTQLRLVEPPGARAARSRRAGRPARVATRSRRAPSWGEWQLDARTRRIGREGVATARRALAQARATEELGRAS